MVVDCHAHVYAWPMISPPSRSDNSTFNSAERQIALMDRLHIDRAVILPLTNAEAPAEPQSLGEILLIRDSYPDRFIPFCNFDPRLPKDPGKITADDFVALLGQYRYHGCYGVGELTARIGWDHPAIAPLLAACSEVGFPVTFHTIPQEVDSYGVLDSVGLAGLENVLSRFPDVVFIGHSAGFWSEISASVTPDEKNGYPATPVGDPGAVVRLMRTYPNLYGDLSAGSGFNALARDREFARAFLAEFAGRLFFGLDCNMPDCKTGLLALLAEELANGTLGRVDYDRIMGGNLLRVLGLQK